MVQVLRQVHEGQIVVLVGDDVHSRPRVDEARDVRVARVAYLTRPLKSVAEELARRPSSLSPARDGLIKKGLIYSSERGLIAFTVPHFGKFLRNQPA